MLLRMVERILIVIGGIFTVYWGYLLFVMGIDKTQGEAITFGINLRNFGPGLFFAALGAVILITTMRAAIKTGYYLADPAPGGRTVQKLSSITMNNKEYQRYQLLTNKIPLTESEEKELAFLELKIFP